MAETNKYKNVQKIGILILLALVLAGFMLFPMVIRTESDLDTHVFLVEAQRQTEEGLRIQGSINRDIPQGETLWIYAEHAEITLALGDQVERYHGREGIPSFLKSPGSAWYKYSSPGIARGTPVVWTVSSYYGEEEEAAQQLLKQLYVGDGSGLYQLLLGQVGFFGLVLLCALAAGLMYLVEGIIDICGGMTADGVRIALFGFCCFSGSVWSISDRLSPFLSLLVAPPWVVTLIDMSSFLLFPVALALLMRHYMRGIWAKRLLNGVFVLELSMAVLCSGLQLLGVADVMEQQAYIGVAALISICTAMVGIALDLRHYRDPYLWLLLLTVMPVFAVVVVEGANLFLGFIPRRITMQYGFSISVFLMVLQLASYVNGEKARREKLLQMELELADSKISILLSQIKPHFLYNSLLGIKQLCDTDAQRASQALEHFSYYLRSNLDSLTEARLVPFSKELDHVKNYLYLEQMRFPKKLQVAWELEEQDFFLPPLTLQPIVENAVKYGIVKKKGGGTLTVRSQRNGNFVVLTVEDTGVGFDPAQPKEDGQSHVGLKNVESRLWLLCGGTLTLESTVGMGTAVKLSLPQHGVRKQEKEGDTV